MGLFLCMFVGSLREIACIFPPPPPSAPNARGYLLRSSWLIPLFSNRLTCLGAPFSHAPTNHSPCSRHKQGADGTETEGVVDSCVVYGDERAPSMVSMGGYDVCGLSSSLKLPGRRPFFCTWGPRQANVLRSFRQDKTLTMSSSGLTPGIRNPSSMIDWVVNLWGEMRCRFCRCLVGESGCRQCASDALYLVSSHVLGR